MKQDNQTYISKTLKQGNITITIRRPVLTEDELEAKRKQIVTTLEGSLRECLARI